MIIVIYFNFHFPQFKKDSSFSRESFLFIAEMLAKKDPVVAAMAGEFSNDNRSFNSINYKNFTVKIADACGTIKSDRCNQAAKFVECMHETAANTEFQKFEIL